MRNKMSDKSMVKFLKNSIVKSFHGRGELKGTFVVDVNHYFIENFYSEMSHYSSLTEKQEQFIKNVLSPDLPLVIRSKNAILTMADKKNNYVLKERNGFYTLPERVLPRDFMNISEALNEKPLKNYSKETFIKFLYKHIREDIVKRLELRDEKFLKVLHDCAVATWSVIK